jgi:hypothetical protein
MGLAVASSSSKGQALTVACGADLLDLARILQTDVAAKAEAAHQERAAAEAAEREAAERHARKRAGDFAQQAAEAKAKQEAVLKAEQDAAARTIQEARRAAKREAELRAQLEAQLQAKAEVEAKRKAKEDALHRSVDWSWWCDIDPKADTLALASMEGTSDAQVDGMVAAHLAGLVDRAQAVVQRLTSVQAGREAARGAHSASSSVESLAAQPRPPARGKAAARSVASPRKVRRKTRPTVATAASKPVTAVRIPPELRKGGVTRMSARKAQAAGGMDGGGGGTGMDGWVLGTGATPN